MENIVWFEELSSDDVEIAGGKGASLGEMINAGLPVPPGFAITAQAYEKFVTEAGVLDRINDLLSEVDVDDSDELRETGEKARNIILEAEIPEDVREDIVKSYRELSKKTGKDNVSVAVRSSATAEDMPDASFAGQQETYLHISGEEELLKKVQECWSSLFTDRAIFYREKNNYSHKNILISVPIQKMVDSEKSGVAFTSHPSTGDRSKIVIEANWGLGETVVSGSVTPDTYIVDKETGEILDVTIGSKEAMTIRDKETGETIEKATPQEKREAQVIDSEQAKELAELGRKVEDHYKTPQDVEWAEENGKIYLVQSRPITVLYGKDEDDVKIDKPSGIILQGLGASPGKASGKVKIISSSDDIDRVEDNDILVAEMTAPDWVPAMRKAAAIVTDEGGTTCFTGDTRVLTDSGILPIREIHNSKDSDIKVLTVDEKTFNTEWKSVLGSTKRTSGVWEVSMSQKGESSDNIIKVTPDHGMMVFENRDLIEKELRDVINESEMVTAVDYIPSPVMRDGGEFCSRDLAYLSGAIASDGSVKISSRRGKVTFRQKDTSEKEEFINQVRNIFSQEFGTDLIDRGTEETGGVIRGEEMSGKANRYECQRKKPAEELLNIENNLQEFVLNAERQTVASFLAGFIDGDGSFNGGHESGRIHIYTNKDIAESIVLACLRLGIFPQVYENRDIYNIQIVEKLEKLLEFTNRVDGGIKNKVQGTKLFPARQILRDILPQVNKKGKIKPYVQGNHLIGSDKIKNRVMSNLSGKEKKELEKIVDSDLRAQRVKKVREIGEKPVYNLEIEDNHNYIVFTERLTPILVHNCHAAIVSRELGTPAIVGTGDATDVLEDGLEVTVDGSSGNVSEGFQEMVRDVEEEEKRSARPAVFVPSTATDVKVNISLPDMAEDVARETQAEGVGLLRAEHMLLNIGKHPRRLLEEGGEELMIKKFFDGITTVAEAFDPYDVWYRTLDLKTAEFRNLEGGEEEPEEPNPMIGWRGVRRFVDPENPEEQEILKIELKAIKKVVEKGNSNVGVMLPMAQHPEELRRFKRLAREVGLEPHEDIDVGIMVEIPATALIIEEFIKEGIDFVSFGTNDLTQFTLAVDRDNERIAELYDERHPAVQKLIKNVIEKCNEAGIESSICGQAGSYPDVVEKLVQYGISSVSANSDAVDDVRKMINKTEKSLILSHARDEMEESG